MNKFLWPALLALTMTACGTTGQQASVEDRTQDQAATTPTPAPATPAAGAESTGVAESQVSSAALPADPRKDPASPLAKRSVYFDFDSYVVKDEYRPALEAHAGYLMSKSDARLILQGNADERGSREYNLALGQKRAEAVRKALTVLGVNNAQVEAISFGEEKPRNSAGNEAAYAENRRADLVYGDE
jgi:peptidoglycan-associated lipoprotein